MIKIFFRQCSPSTFRHPQDSEEDVTPMWTKSLDVLYLSSYSLSREETEVLALGLEFYPKKNVNVFEVVKYVNLFACNLTLKALYSKTSVEQEDLTDFTSFSVAELKALWDLSLLLEEGDPTELIDQVDLGELLHLD